MIARTDCRDKIKGYITENLTNVDEDQEIHDDDNIFMKGFVNSLFAMKLLSFVEKEFEITVDDDDIEISKFSSVNKIVELIEKKRVLHG